MFKLSPRMQLIYDHLIPGKPVWDFCCDHGYMGLNAYESGRFPSVHFVDQVRHIIEQLEERFHLEHHDEDLATQAYFLATAGEDLRLPIEGSVVIAGVGPNTILKIVSSLVKSDALKAHRLILCPQGGEQKVVYGLAEIPDFNYQMTNEDCKIEERGRIRKLLILHKKDQAAL